MNRWAQVAKIFDLELNERFNIEHYEGDFYFYDTGLAWVKHDVTVSADTDLLYHLIRGSFKVIKKAQKPKRCLIDSKTLRAANWASCEVDLSLWKADNHFKTKEEAEKKRNELLKHLKEKFEEA